MFLLIGTKQEIIKDNWSGEQNCSHCGEKTCHHLERMVFRVLIFFIPIISITARRFLICDKCGEIRELSKAEYKDIKSK